MDDPTRVKPESETTPDSTEGGAVWAAPPTPSGRRVDLGRLLRFGILGFFIIAAVAGVIFRDRLFGAVQDLGVGDCFDVPSVVAEIKDVQRRPCNEPHTGEVFFVADFPDQDAYPSDVNFDDWVARECLPAFAAYTGSEFDAREDLDAGYFGPTADGWRLGDHEMICYLTPIDGSPTSISHRKT